jgi:hypothetical protein
LASPPSKAGPAHDTIAENCDAFLVADFKKTRNTPVLHIPLLIIPFILYNVVIAGLAGVSGSDPWMNGVLSVTMISGGSWRMNLGETMAAFGLVIMFFEILKSTRTSNASVLDHLLSTFVFVAFLVEFLVVPAAATSVFFLLMIMALIDVMAGFSVSIRSAGRDVSFN